MGIKTSLTTSLKKNINPLRLAVVTGLGIVSVGVVVGVIGSLAWQNRTRQLKLFAGSATGESFILSKALATVVKKYYPKIVIDVVETGGTTESLKGLEAGSAQLAAAQADVPTGSRARIMAVFFSDSFQLIVPDRSSIRSFADLKGKRIALPQKGGQYKSFLTLANHFGLKEANFLFMGESQAAADAAYRTGRADAAFYVRVLGNITVRDLIRGSNSRLIPIDQAKALQIKHPAFESSIIPIGAYRGNPSIPATDLDTIAVQRVLLVDKDVEPEVVRTITLVLNEQRQEIARAISEESLSSLATYIDRPKATGGTGIAIHPGAIAYYERDKPSFVQENADYVALILTIILLMGSWIAEAKSWIDSQRKDAADIYIDVAVELMQDELTATPEDNRIELDKIFMKAAKDLVEERISQESFCTFNEAYKSARELLERKIHAQQEMIATQSRLMLIEAETVRKQNADRCLMSILELAQAHYLSSAEILQKLDSVMLNAAQDLIEEKISQESFRTLTEAYKVVMQRRSL